jgi:flagellar hook protein FlgE
MSLRALNTGVSGIKQFQSALDNIGNNLANINTIGFKSSRVEFADTLNQTLKSSAPDSGAGYSGTATAQVGNGVTVAGIKNLFTQGAVTQTGVSTDLAITGEGFFTIRKPNANPAATTSEYFATRAGDFRLDSNGYLVTNNGYRVQGITDSLLPGGASDYADGANTGDIKIDPDGITAISTSPISSVAIDTNGKVNVTLQDGTQFVRGQLLLQNFTNPNALMKSGNNLYTNLENAGRLTGTGTFGAGGVLGGKPNTSGMGRIDAEALELSNVDISREFANMITTQRAFQANARVVTTSDQILQEIVQLVR